MLTPEENFALARREHDDGKTRVDSTPPLLTIESTSICNLRCVMCPHGVGGVERPKHMPEELIALLAEPLAAAREAQLHGIGEPLASPAFWRALDSELFHPDCVLNINTNLTLLNDRRLAALLGAKPRLRLNVSLDAATPQTYARIRGADFDEVIGNIRRLVAARGTRTRPALFMNMTLMRENIEEAAAFVELAHGLGADRVYLWQMNRAPEAQMKRHTVDRADWRFNYAEQGLWNFPALSNRCLRVAQQRAKELGIPLVLEGFRDIFFDEPEAAETVLQPAMAAVTATAGIPTPPATAGIPTPPAGAETVRDCRAPWEWALISTDGDVRPCCYSTGTIGNLNDKSFAEIWNGADAQALRRDLSTGAVNYVCRNAACKYVKNSSVPEHRLSAAIKLRRRLDAAFRDRFRPAWRKIPPAGRRRILGLWKRLVVRP
jgi:MoaA/NifB/PqqE/SkfB family radical SAM enzyme